MEAQLTGTVRVGEQSTAPFPLDTSRLTPPYARPGLVDRSDLLARLTSDNAPPVVAVTAAAGYGKSTLLRQVADRTSRPTTWLTLDDDDNDPVVLLTYLAVALDRVAPVDPELFRLLAVEYPSVTAITRRLGSAFAAWPRPGVIFLDDVHALENPECHDVVATLVAHVSDGSRVALASRTELPLPLPRLRAEGRILEVGPDDLALDHAEATALLDGAGATLDASEVHDLVEVAEGWAVAIYLAGRSVRARGGAGRLDLARMGQSRGIAAYAHAELLSALSDRTVTFLTRSAVLDRMSGPLCDAALRTFDSAERLETMSRSNLLVTPLDDRRGWYRYHHMFRDLLRAELERREPALVPELNRRAGQWCQANGLPDAAVEYAMAAGDTDRVAAIVQERVLPLYRTGRVVTLQRWFDWFDDGGHMPSYPRVAAAGAWTAALTGRVGAAERWADAAEHPRSGDATSAGEGSSLDGQVALLRALLCRDGVDRAMVDAAAAVRLLSPASSWRATALIVLGLVHVVSGSAKEAERAFIEAVEMGWETGAPGVTSVALAQRALLALDRGEPEEADALSADACAVMDDGRLQDHVTNVFVFAVAARMAMRVGDAPRARTLLTRAQRLRPRLTYAIPDLAVQARLELVRILLALTDVAGARTVLREVDDILQVRPKLGVLTQQAEKLREQAEASAIGAIGVTSLTAAELRLLPLLQTHLTFREIATRLYVSPHTIKTQAISIYRKLGVSSRSDAMRAAAESGLLPA